MDATEQAQFNLESQKLQLAEKQARWGYKKFIWGTVVAGIVIAAIPPSFQLATAVLEQVKHDADLAAKQQEFRNSYIQQFLTQALAQDIEVRIRFAEYFANVSPEAYKPGWEKYRDKVVGTRKEIRESINSKEKALYELLSQPGKAASIEAKELERELEWAYKETAYIAPNRSVTVNPRAPEPVEGAVLTGKELASRYKGEDSTSLDSLNASFGGNVKEFLTALDKAGAKVEVKSTLRSPKAAYLRRFAVAIARGDLLPEQVPSYPALAVNWVHRDSAGQPDPTKSRKAALEMVEVFGVPPTGPLPALASRHTEGSAIDMSIDWKGQLAIKKKDGEIKVITTDPKNGENPDLIEVGKTYGVIHASFNDPLHWSNDGH